jgi:hypothetical protein
MNYLINPALNIRHDFDNLQLKYIYFPTVSTTETSIVLGATIINIIGSFVEIDGLRAIISGISSEVTNDTVVIEYIMVDVAEDDVNNVVLNNYFYKNLHYPKQWQ